MCVHAFEELTSPADAQAETALRENSGTIREETLAPTKDRRAVRNQNCRAVLQLPLSGLPDEDDPCLLSVSVSESLRGETLRQRTYYTYKNLYIVSPFCRINSPACLNEVVNSHQIAQHGYPTCTHKTFKTNTKTKKEVTTALLICIENLAFFYCCKEEKHYVNSP